jgi:hypothetical protein
MARFRPAASWTRLVTGQEKHMRFRSAVLAVACSALAISAVLGASAAALPARSVPPSRWVRSVCTSISDWQSTIQQGSNLTSSLQGATDISQVQAQVVSYLQSTVTASDQLVSNIRKAGTPAVKNGSKIANAFKNGFSQIRDTFATAANTTRNLDTSDPTQFANALTNVGTAIDNGSNAIKSTFSSIDTKYRPRALDRAFNREPACASLRG